MVSVCILVAAGGALLLFNRAGDRELDRTADALVDAIRKGEPEGVLLYISHDFENGREDYERVCARIQRHLKPGEYEAIQVRDVEIEVMGNVGKTRCRIRLVRPRTIPVPFVEYRVHAEWKNEEEGWRVISADAEQVTLRK